MTSSLPSQEAPVAWQHRLFYADTAKWSDWRPGRNTSGFVNTSEERALVPAESLATMRRERDAARQTNRNLNRVNQQLQSDIAHDRHFLESVIDPHSPTGTAQDKQSWSFKRDTAMLAFHKEKIECGKKLAATEVKLASAAAEVVRLREDTARVVDNFVLSLSALPRHINLPKEILRAIAAGRALLNTPTTPDTGEM